MSVPHVSNSSRGHSPPIAVIGMECIFPEAENMARYWDNIVREIDCISDIPPSRWQVDDYFDPDPRTPDKTYCKRGGFIPEIDFDPTEFGLPPNILEVTDVSQLLALVVARRAMEDAGYGRNGREFDRDRVGVILGAGVGQKLLVPLIGRIQDPIWRKALKSSGVADGDADQIISKIKAAYIPWAEDSFPGLLTNVIAGRIASRLNLGGTNCVVDAACASSLAAAKLAISDLEQDRSDMIITGGVDTDNSPFMYMCFSKTPALTPNSHARPFDADSDGILIGEGLGMLVLKRLEDARRDGDRVYAVIRGIGSSSDGRSKSIYAPRVEGQVMAIRRSHQDAGITPETVSLIEAHGTGTRAGDICEVEALNKVFAKSAHQHTALGSVKSQIGHTKAAAGAAGLIKTCLALHHKVLPPTLNIETPNSKLAIDDSPLYLNTKARPWLHSPDNNPRRAGVSSFGFGGTNFHFVLEEYDQESDESYSSGRNPYTVLLFAKNKSELAKRCKSALAELQSGDGKQALCALAESCRSVKIPAKAPRIGFVAMSVAEARELLQVSVEHLKANNEKDWEYKGISFRSRAIPGDAKVVALFPGQGSQYVEMGRELACGFPVIRRAWEAVNDLSGETAIGQVVFPPPAFDTAGRSRQADELQRTEHAQPAIGAFSMGLYKLLGKAGFQADMAAGHSFGELTALWSAGVFDDSDFLALAQARGKAMATPDDPKFDAGTMLAVKAGVAQVEAALIGIKDVIIANDNSGSQVVLSGPTDIIEAARKALETKKISSVLLPVSAAFHTPLVAHASRPFSKAFGHATFRSPQMPVYSNASAKAYPKHHRSIRKILGEHILSPVRFREEIEQLHAAGGYCFVEFGPKRVLTGLVNQILQDKPHLAIALNPKAAGDSDLQLREAVVKLRVAGLALKDLAPQGSPKPGSTRKKKMTIRLSGNNYVSQKTKDRYEETMSNGHQIQTVAAQPANTGQNSLPEAPCCDIRAASGPVIQKPASAKQPTNQHSGGPITTTQLPKGPASPDAENQGQLLQSIERSLAQFYALQVETLRVHEQYLGGQMEYSKIFFQLMQQQYALLGQGALPPAVMNVALPAPPPPVQFVSPQTAPVTNISAPAATAPPIQAANPLTTPRAGVFQPPAPAPALEEHYSKPVVQPLGNPAHLTERPPGNGTGLSQAAAETTAKSAPAEEINIETLTRSMLKIVSERTGYPEDMLDMEMHIEADLGIDSIKRVEILGAMVEAHPELPELSPDDLAELQTFGQIVDFLHGKVDA